jgi:hypothetical protein
VLGIGYNRDVGANKAEFWQIGVYLTNTTGKLLLEGIKAKGYYRGLKRVKMG